jgi:hypothetical protein
MSDQSPARRRFGVGGSLSRGGADAPLYKKKITSEEAVQVATSALCGCGCGCGAAEKR